MISWKDFLETVVTRLEQAKGDPDEMDEEWLYLVGLISAADIHRLQRGLAAFGAGLLSKRSPPKQTLDEQLLFWLGKWMLKGVQKLQQNRAARQRQQERIAQLPNVQSVDKLRRLSPEDFEYWTARYFERFGFKQITVTSFSADFGVDVHMTCPNGKKAVAQCKNKVRSNKPVGSPTVQQTYGAMKLLEAEVCYVVTTGTFSEKARELGLRKDIVLLDGSFLLSGQRPPGSRKRIAVGKRK